MEFENKYYIVYAIAGCIIWIYSCFYFFKKSQFITPEGNTSNKTNIFKTIAIMIGIIGWGFLGYSLMGPREPLGFEKSKAEVNDIFLVVDVSDSMKAVDFKPNRLEAAKNKIRDFVKLHPTDRIGIIMFSEKAFTLLPLSTDLELINRMVSDIRIGFLGSGTNIGDALGLAVARAAQSIAKNKVVILFTDGVSNVGNMTPLEAAEKARDAKVKIYSIGIGGDKDALMPVRGAFGRTSYRKIPGGSFDRPLLKKISALTGGKDYIAKDVNALKSVLEGISKLEKSDIEVTGRMLYKDHYYNYLMIGSILLLLSTLMLKGVLGEFV